MSAPPSPHDHGPRGTWIVIATIAVAILAAWVLIRRPEPRVARDDPNARPSAAGPAGQRRLSDDDCQRLAELKNRALAHLERSEFDAAVEILEPLVRELPDEPAAVRNLVVARLMALEKEEDVAGLDELLERAAALEPESAVPHRLAARAAKTRRTRALARGDAATAARWERRAQEELDAAIARSPADPSLWIEVAELLENPVDAAAARPRKTQALREAYAQAPHNLAVTTRRLLNQAEEHDPQLGETIEAARSLFAPLVESVEQRASSVKVKDLLDNAASAATNEDWNRATGQVRMLQNVIVPEDWWRSDNHRVKPDRNILEFVESEFRTIACSSPADKASEESPAVRFVRRAENNALPAIEGGAIRQVRVADFDLDGMADLLVLGDARLSVLARQQGGMPWSLATYAEVAQARGMLLGDLDREGIPTEKGMAARRGDRKPRLEPGTCQEADLDVVVFGAGQTLVFRNERDEAGGTRQLVPVEQEPALASLAAQAGLLVDFDHDGDLDLVLSAEAGISLWLNRGDARFFDVTARSQLPGGTFRPTDFVAVDWDQDLDLDVLAVGSGSGPAGYLENLRHGQFRWRAFEQPWAELTGSRSLVLPPAHISAAWSLVGAGPEGIRQISPGGPYLSSSSAPVSSTPADHLLLWDFDNDSFADFVAWNRSKLEIHRGLGGDKYEAQTALLDSPIAAASACAVGDLDGDGDQDLVVAVEASLAIYDNDGGNKNGWLDVRIRGEEDNKSGSVNHLGIGSVIELRAGPFYRAQVVTGQVTHFGLGARDKADLLRVIWSNGIPQVLLSPALNQMICEVHRVDSSCPFLYIWNGSEFVFYTDLLWNAPLGLQLAEGVLARPREWEYLKIDGDRFQPRDGKYVLQITGELWEADYFDQVELIAVDHPAEVEIYSNEKVGPAELAEFKVHTVKHPRTPVAARNARGEDVLGIVARADGEYLKGHTFNYCKGLTDEHFLELDLGDLRDARQVTLFLTGWIYPSNTSNRVAVSQNPGLPPMKPPALWVPDADGQWREVRPFMGFPGGKTKTIAVDLSGVFLADDYRVRIVTNWEFYWDQAFFSVDEPVVPVQMQTLAPASADLHYRGFSTLVPNPGWGPESYDYSRVSTEPAWPPMSGFFTRYGDVTELLLSPDDRQAILASGDELTVTFDEPAAPPPPGWKRDFLLHNVGWDKDAVLNTVYGQTVEPLPFHRMRGYPYGPDQTYPQTPQHQDYLRTWQTRTQPAARFWRQILDAPQEGSAPAAGVRSREN